MLERNHPSTCRLPRRQFLDRAARTLAVGTLATPLFAPPRTHAATRRTSANDRITVGAIGVGGRASLLLEQLPESAQIVALSDCNLRGPKPSRPKSAPPGPSIRTTANCWTVRTSTR